jgi:hypothetical protein
VGPSRKKSSAEGVWEEKRMSKVYVLPSFFSFLFEFLKFHVRCVYPVVTLIFLCCVSVSRQVLSLS